MFGEGNAGPNLKQQFADFVFALCSSFVQRRELPQVSHVDRGSVSDQQLGHLVVTIRAGVMERNQTSVKVTQQLCTHEDCHIFIFHNFALTFKLIM